MILVHQLIQTSCGKLLALGDAFIVSGMFACLVLESTKVLGGFVKVAKTN